VNRTREKETPHLLHVKVARALGIAPIHMSRERERERERGKGCLSLQAFKSLYLFIVRQFRKWMNKQTFTYLNSFHISCVLIEKNSFQFIALSVVLV